MEYDAEKLISLTRQGLKIDRAQVQVRGRNSLAGVESRLDGVPVVGALVEDVIRRRHRESQPSAIAQVKTKVNRQVRTRMDREADEKLHALEAKCSEGLMAPLARFALWAEPIDMSTTAERAVVRIRLASEQHLGAHTPRPSAPSDSLASVQLHESALNNAIRGMGLDGRRITVGELHALLREKFTNRPEAPPADLPQKAIVHFAAHDAIRVSCHDDCVELILNIVELRKGRDSIRNVGVHAFFRPVVDGLDVKFVRDGTLQFEGAHLRSGPRLVLHSVFGKLLRRDQEVAGSRGPTRRRPAARRVDGHATRDRRRLGRPVRRPRDAEPHGLAHPRRRDAVTSVNPFRLPPLGGEGWGGGSSGYTLPRAAHESHRLCRWTLQLRRQESTGRAGGFHGLGAGDSRPPDEQHHEPRRCPGVQRGDELPHERPGRRRIELRRHGERDQRHIDDRGQQKSAAQGAERQSAVPQPASATAPAIGTLLQTWARIATPTLTSSTSGARALAESWRSRGVMPAV